MNTENNISFAPQLYIKSGVSKIEFYSKAFGAIELNRWNNEDGSLHVAELAVSGAIFYLHEETSRTDLFSPEKHNGSTAVIGLFVPDVDAIMKQAIAVGATEILAAKDYEYGYRQGIIKDPFGHQWMIQKKIAAANNLIS
jgi:PhnB protein